MQPGVPDLAIMLLEIGRRACGAVSRAGRFRHHRINADPEGARKTVSDETLLNRSAERRRAKPDQLAAKPRLGRRSNRRPPALPPVENDLIAGAAPFNDDQASRA